MLAAKRATSLAGNIAIAAGQLLFFVYVYRMRIRSNYRGTIQPTCLNGQYQKALFDSPSTKQTLTSGPSICNHIACGGAAADLSRTGESTTSGTLELANEKLAADAGPADG